MYTSDCFVAMMRPKTEAAMPRDDRIYDATAELNVASLVFSQAFVNWHKAFMSVLSPYALTYSQWIILRTLAVSGSAMSPTELNRYLTIEGTSISLVLNGIEARGLVQRRKSRSDRRMVKVRLTEVGMELLAELDSKIRELIQSIFGPLSASERRQVLKLCRKIRDASVLRIGGNPEVVEAILLKFSGVDAAASEKSR